MQKEVNKVANSNKKLRTEFLFDYHFGFLFLNLLFMVGKRNHACTNEKKNHYLKNSLCIVFERATETNFDNKVITKSLSELRGGNICLKKALFDKNSIKVSIQTYKKNY